MFDVFRFQDQLLCCTSSNRLGHFDAILPTAAYSRHRLKSDLLKGNVTEMCVLPINR